MLLAIDIGNTNISFGVFRDNLLVKKFSMPAKSYNIKSLKSFLGKINPIWEIPGFQPGDERGFLQSGREPRTLARGGSTLTAGIICSVVPESTDILEKDFKSYLGIKPYILGKNINVPIKNCYRKPWQAGQDRLVNAYAGMILFGAPLIVIDFGTAITFDIVSEQKDYLGGMILPGLSTALESLSQKTALLPEINLSKPKEFIGRDTNSAMLSGIVYGFAALADGLIGKIRKEIGKNAKVIVTGGDATFIGKYCAGIDKIDIDLTIKGLNFMYNANSK